MNKCVKKDIHKVTENLAVKCANNEWNLIKRFESQNLTSHINHNLFGVL